MTATPPAPVANPSPAIVAGRYAGKPIYCEPSIYPLFKELEKAAGRGSHWARIAIKELGSLATGHIGKNNVFVEESPHLRRQALSYHTKDSPYIKHSITVFYAFLPGLKATIAQRPDGSYFVVSLVLDERYFEATEKAKPGLYHVSKRGNKWGSEYVASGQIEKTKGRTVAIADTCYRNPGRAIASVVPKVGKMLGSAGKSDLLSDGFDLYFTPGQRRLGGLINYNSMASVSAHGAATLLADTMYNARSVKSVRWTAELGGAAIFTQAMQVLAARGANLDGHSAYLYRPRTSPGDATRVAHQLNMTLADDFVKTGFDMAGAVSQWRVAGARLKNENDLYDKSAHYKAAGVGLGKAATVAGLSAVAGSTMGAGYPAVAAITAVLGKVAGAVSVVVGTGAVAQHVVEPHAHKLHSKRIKKG